jgi:hypothetical protein
MLQSTYRGTHLSELPSIKSISPHSRSEITIYYSGQDAGPRTQNRLKNSTLKVSTLSLLAWTVPSSSRRDCKTSEADRGQKVLSASLSGFEAFPATLLVLVG